MGVGWGWGCSLIRVCSLIRSNTVCAIFVDSAYGSLLVSLSNCVRVEACKCDYINKTYSVNRTSVTHFDTI